uniref:Growth arrest-specific protein 8 domain-containing protein n=1 Tax=Chromera velia CCMP2878 TaxID=1169474 RepID=A0A0G4GAS2_9ALVE|mmetsp:Transcript_48007/g.94797  ORF Transcript_48007/g.94797 Transcript_48007/m.94797 type:complete len:475 (+) Transcript_48007:160-1584(+)|eukprot:Cvel_20947.t1-p1 / transcript=Cvel_20947.t1 / gene=Cvel_20947 / organism=Chromera_velia_CCMP2878 / gene_product=Growth arrest-specific protein 8 homolog, putative / transcript_product=Growth arrest-specific protein 8 homolog, putative / location=Cvel_scaffold1924:26949-33579(-) / protein_length=474 / sequence_SO=supercontig / SO=protein_coding / is_pseudo=false
MAPKKKKSKEPEDPEADIDPEFKGRDLDDMRERIEAYRQRLQKASKDRNYMQLEKDMVQRFFEITHNEVKQLEAKLLLKDNDIETLEKHHRVSIKAYEQKVKLLEYEHRAEQVAIQQAGEETVQHESQEHEHSVIDMTKEKAELRKELRNVQLANEDQISRNEKKHQGALQKMRQKFQKEHQELEAEFQEQVKQLAEELELRRRVEIHEVEERKNQHIADLLTNHWSAFDEIKAYYNDITHDNLQLIKSLKEEIAEMKAREKRNQREMHRLTQLNRELAEPLQENRKKRAFLQDQLKSYTKDKMALKNLKARSSQLDEKIKEAKGELRTMEERFRKVEKERDELYRRFNKGVREIRRKAEFKNVVLEKKLDLLTAAMNEKQGQLDEVLRNAQLAPEVIENIAGKLEQVLGSKNRLIKELQYEVHRASKVYNDTCRVMESKLQELGVPVDEVGFEPIQTATSSMPAGLVARVMAT